MAVNRPPMLTAQQALDHLLSHAKLVAESLKVTTQEALGRVLAEDVASLVDVPPLDNTSMDGYAVRAADASTPGQILKVAQRYSCWLCWHAVGARYRSPNFYWRTSSPRR